MKIRTLLIAVIGFFILTSCSATKVQEYANTEPKLDLFSYFEGKTQAYGQFQGRSGEVKRRFTVDITGTIIKDTLTMDERFVYDDGETEQRIWIIDRIAPNQYRGTAGDVIGYAEGESAGSVFNWRYTLDLPYKDSSIHVKFNDWMFLHPNGVMLNRAEVTQWGFKVGEITLFFIKDASFN